MGKISKYLFFALLIFIGLYFFGDFEINDVNVRAYLQQKVTVEKVNQFKNNSFHFMKKVGMLFDDTHKYPSTQIIQPEARTTVQKMDISSDFFKKPLDKISEQDQRKLMQMLQTEIEKK